MADFQSRVLIFHCFVMFLKARQISLLAASSLGKCLRVLLILRSRMCRDSMALVV